MKQLSIFTKNNHHSDKDLTISRGDNGNFNMTFRNESWLSFTNSKYAGFYATKGGVLTITDGNNPRATTRYKLSVSGQVPSRYLHVGTAADPNVRGAIEKLLKDKDFINLDISYLASGGVNDISIKADAKPTPEPTPEPTPALYYECTPQPAYCKNNVETVAEGDGLIIKVNLQKCTPDVRRFFLQSLTHDDLVNECLYLLEKFGGL